LGIAAGHLGTPLDLSFFSLKAGFRHRNILSRPAMTLQLFNKAKNKGWDYITIVIIYVAQGKESKS
jgi:hypothetical protein